MAALSPSLPARRASDQKDPPEIIPRGLFGLTDLAGLIWKVGMGLRFRKDGSTLL